MPEAPAVARQLLPEADIVLVVVLDVVAAVVLAACVDGAAVEVAAVVAGGAEVAAVVAGALGRQEPTMSKASWRSFTHDRMQRV
mmetsp:Transcript_39180/g.63296  ORF Transcript_39180/g.63296 Transcript_39180/m.63296 type:complete len:84 (-) Transcript_39180:1443-1694(-)